MIHPDKLFGRLGNKMFQMAFLYSYARDHGLDFYFQDEWFFMEHAEAIRALFSSDIPSKTNMVAIHVRRGDYVNNPLYVDLFSSGYYDRAMWQFSIGTEFLVFSDDIKWCKENMKGVSFWETGNEIDDLNKMASCKGHIIANSSFSWWGAWLNPSYPNNKVIAPKDWFNDGVQRCVLPDHWIKI